VIFFRLKGLLCFSSAWALVPTKRESVYFFRFGLCFLSAFHESPAPDICVFFPLNLCIFSAPRPGSKSVSVFSFRFKLCFSSVFLPSTSPGTVLFFRVPSQTGLFPVFFFRLSLCFSSGFTVFLFRSTCYFFPLIMWFSSAYLVFSFRFNYFLLYKK